MTREFGELRIYPLRGGGCKDDILSNILGPNEDGGSTGKKKEIYVTGRATPGEPDLMLDGFCLHRNP